MPKMGSDAFQDNVRGVALTLSSPLQEICGQYPMLYGMNWHRYSDMDLHAFVTTSPGMAGTTAAQEVKLFWHQMVTTTTGEHRLHYEEATVPADGAGMPSSDAVQGK